VDLVFGTSGFAKELDSFFYDIQEAGLTSFKPDFFVGRDFIGQKISGIDIISEEDFKLKIVKEYESGRHSVLELEKIYDISNPTLYNWIYKLSKYNKKSIQVVEMKDSQVQKLKELEQKVKDLERIVGQKQIAIDYLEKMIELAEDELKIDIKKNSNTPQSGGSKGIKKK
jgi:transposase-like protein